MDAGELQALLEAAARELAAVTAELPADGELAAEVSSALEAAASACGEAAAAAARPGGAQPGACDEGDEVAREARALRAGAIRARDTAEARLRGLQQERADLLERMQQLTEVRSDRAKENEALCQAAHAGEAELLVECEEFDRQVAELQSNVRAGSEKLLARGIHGRLLNRRRRELQRQHARSAAENVGAQQVLQLQRDAEVHLQEVEEQHHKVGESLAVARRDCVERAEALWEKRTEQQERFRQEASELEARLEELHRTHESRWTATDAETRRRLTERAKQAAEARTALERRIAELDAERESEAAAWRAQLEHQKRILEEERESVMAELEAKLSEKRRQLKERADEERGRCSRVRSQHLRRAEDHMQEVQRYRRNIDRVSENYRARQVSQPPPRLAPLPPASSMMAASPRSALTSARAARTLLTT
mmetsp:Transcript_10718/g.33363  ORF Transcript_10718/g.33363 Transcript_10718/m.33363 type:complete len:426 (-) Transcript_10718:52-1329(-)